MRFPIQLLTTALLLLALFSCKEEKKEEEKIFPALSFIKSQVGAVDTSLFAIRKIIITDSAHADTIHIHRDQFRETASPFLSLPDITDKKFSGQYKEISEYDDAINRVMLITTPIKNAAHEIQRQEVVIQPDISGDKVTSIFFTTTRNTKDSAITQRLLWRTDHSFQVSTIKQFPGQPETFQTLKVIWGEDE